MTHRHRRLGFSLTELLVVLALIAVLLGLLFPALVGVKSTGLMTTSMSNLRQIGTWMRMYSQDNREFIVPSRFDYAEASYAGKVRAPLDPSGAPVDPVVGERNEGTWADILWTVFEGGVFPDATKDRNIRHDYRYDSPDGALYELLGDDIPNPLRSAVKIKTYPDFKGRDESNCDPDDVGDVGGVGPKIGDRWDAAVGHPGFFAANNFFDAANPGQNGPGWVLTGQIKSPERSMYLVDSLIGETIDPVDAPFDSAGPCLEVDFRYPGDVCLMLFLDGHAQTVSKFPDLVELQGKRQIRVQQLDER